MKIDKDMFEMMFELEDIIEIEEEGYNNTIDISVTGDQTFLLANGIVSHNSARGGLMPVLGRKEFGFYEMKGVPLNAYDASQSKFTNNKELSELYSIAMKEGYEYIIYGTDQDLDGIHIRGLLLGFFRRYLPDYLNKGKTGSLNTPILGAKKGGKVVKWWYRIGDFDADKSKGLDIKFYKGLGSWKEKDLKEIIAKDGIDKMIDIFEVDDETILDNWLLGDKKYSDKRKEYIKANTFSLIKL